MSIVIACDKRKAFAQGSPCDDAIQPFLLWRDGLLRFARNDAERLAMTRIRHCGERSDEAIHSFISRRDGLLRVARNDAERLAMTVLKRIRESARRPRAWRRRLREFSSRRRHARRAARSASSSPPPRPAFRPP